MATIIEDQSKGRILQVFRYIQALEQYRNPVVREIDEQPWSLWFKNLPSFPTIIKGDFENTLFDTDTEVSSSPFILKVKRPTLTDAPPPPLGYNAYLRDTWKRPDASIQFNLSSLPKEEDEKELTEAQVLERYLQEEDFAQWYQKRNLWAEKELPVRGAMGIYNQFYELYARLERESEQFELMLGDGLLHWEHPTGRIHHPILLLRLKLEFDPSVPEFTLCETEQPTELYSSVFRSVGEVTGTVMSRLQEEITSAAFHPLGGQDTEEYLVRLISQLSPYGRYLKTGEKVTSDKAPYLQRSPLVFLRKRSLGYSKALEEIIKDIPERSELPEFLNNIVGIDHGKKEEKTEIRPIDPNGEDEEILLSKPANSEQLLIADRLNHYNAVLVQGPPGTGKTHTIANLIGHLLAQGKSVLVTSHTSKALSVLHEKIVEPLQPLCLSVLSDDSRKQLERSVDSITERLASSNPDQLEREALALQNERIDLLKKLRETRQKLLEAREDEYRSLVIAGEEYDPAQAARQVNASREQSSWIPGPIRLGAPLPLSERELIELYRTNLSLTSEDEKELGSALPDPEQLVVPHEFEQWIRTYQVLSNKKLDLGKEFWKGTSGIYPEALEAHQTELGKNVSLLEKAPKWQLELIQVGIYGDEHKKPWQSLLDQIDKAYKTGVATKEILLQYDPQVSESCLADTIEEVLEEIIQHLKNNGSLSFFKLITKPSWKNLINESRVNGSSPKKIEDFEALKALIGLRKVRKKLLERWERQVTVLEGPTPQELGKAPEVECYKLRNFLLDSLHWYPKVWLPLVEKLQKDGFLWHAFYDKIPVQLGEHGEIKRLKNAVTQELTQIIEVQADRLRLERLRSQLNSLKSRIEQSNSSKSQVSLTLLSAVQKLEPTAYRKAFQVLVELTNKNQDLSLRKQYLAQLEKDAPTWASAIAHREGIHGEGQLPGKPQEAWVWRQFTEELDDRAKKSMDELLSKTNLLARQLREKTALLVEKKAWAAQVRRTTVHQRQALNGWKQLMRKIGKGTGKRAPGLLAEARKHMPMCQSAVPVWIMPLSRVVENFNPRSNSFDVVIIDEASQADVLALTALYMGKQVIVVGDNEQVSPSAVGQNVEDINKLIEEHLQGIPNAKLYDGLFSIYDLAGTVFQPICLREHFRCVTPIIQFSNYLSYDGKIKPLRDESTVKLRPHTVAYRVRGGTSYRKTNEKEAEVIASLVVACTEQPEYQDASIGVISLVGEEQARVIDRYLQNYLPAEEYQKRRIQCGNPAQFQGDERDVIFLSMIDATTEEGTLARKGDGAQDMYKKRYNVAASRARDQMWVVYSMDPEKNLKPGDLRGALIRHAKDPQGIMKMLDTAALETESEFEKQVLFRLRQKGYTVHPQWKVGGYRIDMVIEGNGQRVALECDGDKWHTPENLAEDMSRQSILERLGWRFIRLRGSEFFRDPETIMQSVFSRLEKQFGIFPQGTSMDDQQQEPREDRVKDEIIRRAEVIRRHWNGDDEEEVEEGSEEEVTLTEDELTDEEPKDEPATEIQVTEEQIDEQEKVEQIREDKVIEDKGLEEQVIVHREDRVDNESRLHRTYPSKPESGADFDLMLYLKSKGLEIIDNRNIGGTLWIIGQEELGSFIDELKNRGYRFRYKARGGRMTQNRSAWYLSE